MEGPRPTSFPFRRLSRPSHERQRLRPVHDERTFRRGLRNHPTKICRLVEEARAHSGPAAPARLARSARKARPRRHRFPHRIRHSARSRNPHDPSPSPRHNHRPANWHLHAARLRHLRLPILGQRTNRHRVPPHPVPVEASPRRTRHRLQRLPSRRPQRRIPGLHPRPPIAPRLRRPNRHPHANPETVSPKRAPTPPALPPPKRWPESCIGAAWSLPRLLSGRPPARANPTQIQLDIYLVRAILILVDNSATNSPNSLVCIAGPHFLDEFVFPVSTSFVSA